MKLNNNRIPKIKTQIPNECPMPKMKFQKFGISALMFICHLGFLICHYVPYLS